MSKRLLILVALTACGADDPEPPALCIDGNPRCDERCAVAAAEGPSSPANGEPIGGECDAVSISGEMFHCLVRVDFDDGNIGCCRLDNEPISGAWFGCVEGQ